MTVNNFFKDEFSVAHSATAMNQCGQKQTSSSKKGDQRPCVTGQKCIVARLPARRGLSDSKIQAEMEVKGALTTSHGGGAHVQC